MTENPLLLLALIGVSVWVGRWWVIDYRAALAGKPHERSLPGASPASAAAVAIASLGALFILAGETGGEHVLGLSAEQSRMTVLFGLYSIVGAPVIEEVLFRGYLVIENRGPLHRYRFLVSVNTVRAISWETRRVRIALGDETNGDSSAARDADR